MVTGHGEGGRPALAREARELIEAATQGILSTLDPDGGFPHASIVDVASVEGGDLVTLLSRLAVHRKYAEADDRASILLAPHFGEGDAMQRPRITLVGRLVQEDDRSKYRDRYLAVHPEAEMYLALPDFDFFRLQTERARYIAGFGRMGWLDRQDFGAGDAG